MRFCVKNKFSVALMALMILALSLPAFVLAQQRRDQSTNGVSSTGKTGAPPASGRRPRVHAPSNATVAVQQDLNEALSVIQDRYIDGNKLDFNSVFKSSIIGMLRTLDPHSNYFDKEEFDEMKTDQRSEYFGIGASIQNYSVGEAVDCALVIASTRLTAFPCTPSPLPKCATRFVDRAARK